MPNNLQVAHLLKKDGVSPPGGVAIDLILQTVRTHLGMDVAFVAQFAEGRRVFRQIAAGERAAPMKVGDSHPLEESFCQRVVDGRLPELIQDAALVPEAAAMPVTKALPLGAHLSVPICLRDGSVYGTFCCFSYTPNESLNNRDISFMRAFADLTAQYIEAELGGLKDREDMLARVTAAITDGQMSAVYQPIIRLSDHGVAGFESLARFSQSPRRTPDVWFAEAETVGMGARLELAAVSRALEILPYLPSDVYLAINIGPQTILEGDALAKTLRGFPATQVILEVTEHAQIADYTLLSHALDRFRDLGVRLAIDDAGAGYASFRHILALRPDRIKLDISLIRNIDIDHAKRALAAALIEFSHRTGSQIVAEGVETASELTALKGLGVDYAQGYHLARPMPLADAKLLVLDGSKSQPTTAASRR